MSKPSMKTQIIEEICKERGIQKIDISYDWISILKKGEVEKKLIHEKFGDLNSTVSTKLAKDKYSTYEVLNYYQIPIVEHKVLFNEEIMPDFTYVNGDYECLNNEEMQVIKANDSSQGKDVYVSSDRNQKRQIVESLFEKEIEAVVVCPYMDIEYEYRALFLDGEVIYIYKKEKPFVVGDGKSNVSELIETQLKYLVEPMENLDFSYIPAKNEKVIVGWKHNLSNGAIPLLIDEEDLYYSEVKKIALQAGKVMELSFASVDVIVTKDKKVCVMEVNSNVTISKFCELVPNGYEIGKEIYAKVIDKMFE